MELVSLVAPFSDRDALVALSQESLVLFRCSDADTVIVASAMREELKAPVGVWLVVSPDYPAQLAARDAKTLSHLVHLSHVVIEALTASNEHAEVVRALLTNAQVDFDNAVASIHAAYNRPAPPSPLTVWSHEVGTLSSDLGVLRATRSEVRGGLQLTYFA